MKEMRKWSLPEYELDYRKRVVSEYLKYGSVDELLRANRFSIPMSEPTIHRIIKEWGIVKAAGPNRPLYDTISFFVKLVEKKVPLESLYTRMPPSFTPAVASLHRTYQNLKENVKKKLEERDLRRVATALIITPHNNPENILIGFDISPRKELGKPYGSVSIPMGFSKRAEEKEESILRVLQQEVYVADVVERNFPYKVLPKNPKPFMYVDVADIRVAVYHLELPKNFDAVESFSSHKLKKHQFLKLNETISFEHSHIFRIGLTEIFEGYQEFLKAQKEEKKFSTLYIRSWLNKELEDLILSGEKIQSQPAA